MLQAADEAFLIALELLEAHPGVQRAVKTAASSTRSAAHCAAGIIHAAGSPYGAFFPDSEGNLLATGQPTR